MNIFESINSTFEFVVPIVNWLWNFPTNISWYANIPLIGQLPLMILLIFGVGGYVTIKTGFVQCRYFKKGFNLMMKREHTSVGVSGFSSFMLSTASRIGPGNIAGVTGAISVGGPGALFWMWISAFAGMAIAWAESTLAQIYKFRDGDEYKGGISIYSTIICNGKKWIGGLVGVLFAIYAFASHPTQSYQIFSSIEIAVESFTGTDIPITSTFFYIVAVILVIGTAIPVFKGLGAVSNVCNKIVPVMALGYTVIVVILIVLNIGKVPEFFVSVFTQAFKPRALFGGAIGTVIAQGIKRGLNSNDAGKGTLTIPAAVADANHPAEQGFIQSLGVFFDTMVVCTATGFLVVGGSIWDKTEDWSNIMGNKVGVWAQSIAELVPGTGLDNIVVGLCAVAYFLFAYSSLIGLMSFTPVAISSLTTSKTAVKVVKFCACFIFVPLGILCLMSGQSLDNLWSFVDVAAALMCFANIYFVIKARKIIFSCFKSYEANPDRRFVAEEIGVNSEVWK